MSAGARFNNAEFAQACRSVLAGLGMERAKEFSTPGINCAFRHPVVRESSDKMFRSDETWLCFFLRSSPELSQAQAQAIFDVTAAADVRFLLVVTLGTVPGDVEEQLRQNLANEGVHLALLQGELAEALLADYAAKPGQNSSARAHPFSFARVRDQIRAQVEAAPWKKHFQTPYLQPGRVLPLQKGEENISESDLIRVLHGGSFLLLGEPGAGKTTSLLQLGRDLAGCGPFMPVFLPLGRYRGDIWEILGEVLGSKDAPLAKAGTQALVESGLFVLLLDGINEVQNSDLQARLIDDLNRLTAPGEATARSRWIVSGRVYDYQQGHQQLPHLEARRWEIQPFTADLIYQLMADALGKSEGLALYQDLGESVRDLCSNPLLLNMLLTVYRQHGRAPVGRGALYRQFVDLLLAWGEDRNLFAQKREALARCWPEALTEASWQDMARQALTVLASSMSFTHVSWREAQQALAAAMPQALNPGQAAAALLDDLTSRGVLRCDLVNRVSFFHHTVQEYFRAVQLRARAPEELIPVSGVDPRQRESVIFLAGLLNDPAPLVRRALAVDLQLTFEIVRDAPELVPPDLKRNLAQKLWNQCRSSKFFGAMHSCALMFKRLATLLKKNVDTLASEVNVSTDPTDLTKGLMEFYAQLGEVEVRQRLLAKAMAGEEIPESLLHDAALIAHHQANYERAVKLYSNYVERHPAESTGYYNRGLSYKLWGRKDEALADFQEAIKHANPDDPVRSGMYYASHGSLLYDLGRRPEGIQQVRLALEMNPEHAWGHYTLAGFLETDDLEAAAQHYEQAVRRAPTPEDMMDYLVHLAKVQQKLGRHAARIKTLRQQIALDPTSDKVQTWKQEIAKCRQALDAEERIRSVRERLQEKGELPLPTLVVEWLKAAGLEVQRATSAWVLARAPGENPLPVVLMPEPRVTAAGLRAAIEAVRSQHRQARRFLVVTAADTLELDARHQWAALQDEFALGLIGALEVRDALLQTDLECGRLLDRVLNRSGHLDDPFDYKSVVREPTEFFGRDAIVGDIITRISRGGQVGLYGIHKIGKSSLMEQLRRNLHVTHPEISSIQIELDGHDPGPGDFYCRVLEKLPGTKELPSASSVRAADFRRALADFHQRRSRERPGHRLVIMVDEYAYLIPDNRGRGGLVGFQEVLGVLKTLHQEGWLSLLPCGRTAALNRQGSWGDFENPFIDLLHPCFLGPLNRPENDAMMTTLGRRAKLVFTDSGLEAIFAETAGHPSFSRSLGSLLVRDNKPGPVDPARVQTALEAFLRDRDRTSILRAIYETRMDQDEQHIAQRLATEGPLPQQKLLEGDIARRREILAALKNLIDTSVLCQQPDGTIAHRYGLLRRVIEQEAAELGL